jgi:uncharacterized membrane protein YobD (UPF0266 family)
MIESNKRDNAFVFGFYSFFVKQIREKNISEDGGLTIEINQKIEING